MSVIKPWIPVTAEKNSSGYDISVLNRNYKLTEKSPFFSSVTSLGEELLASPMRIVAENKGVPCEFCSTKTFMMDTSDDERINLISTMESKYVIVNVSHGIEFDGCDEITLSVMPTGRSVAACFGLEPFENDAFDLNKLWLEIPLKKDIIKYFNVCSDPIYNNPEEADEFSKMPAFCRSGIIPEGGIHTSFSPQIYLNGFDKGLGFFFISDEYFENEKNDRVFEVINNVDEWILRIRFLDKTPNCWQDKGVGNDRSRHMLPITYHFGMNVTPVKTMEKRPYSEKNFHIDCFTKIPREMNYDEFFSKTVVDWDSEIGFDRIKRLGVDTLYLHEKWNDIQNFFELTKETGDRLKYIIDECHKRGIKIIPYFGYEISTLSSVFQQTGRKYLMGSIDNGKRAESQFNWYRYPYQRDIKVCYSSGYGDIFVDGIIALQKKYGFDGFYFDGALIASRCANRDHGCGYIDRNGILQPTAEQFELRKTFKKLYKYASENNLTVEAHISFSSLCDCGFYDHSWIGEDIQAALLHNRIDRIPEQLMMAKFTSRDIGVPTYTICYSGEKWSYESGCGVALLYGSIAKPIDIGKPLEYTSELWKMFDEFPIEEAQWLPYYNGNNSVCSDNDAVKVSIYEAKDQILAICVSVSMDFVGDATISGKYAKITDALTGTLISDNGKCSLHFEGIQCKLLLISKN